MDHKLWLGMPTYKFVARISELKFLVGKNLQNPELVLYVSIPSYGTLKLD